MPPGGADTAAEAVTSTAILALALEAAISTKMTRGTGWNRGGMVRGVQVFSNEGRAGAWVTTGWVERVLVR